MDIAVKLKGIQNQPLPFVHPMVVVVLVGDYAS